MKKFLGAIKRVLIVEVDPIMGYPSCNAWLYGVAWRVPHNNHAIAMPIPLNLIAKVARGTWGRMRYPARWMQFGDESAAYAAGRRAGMRDRITDDDIKTYLLRQKINEANFPQEIKQVGLAALNKYLETVSVPLDPIFKTESEINLIAEEARSNKIVNWGAIKKI